MNSLVVIRVGTPNNFFYEHMERGIWSTPEYLGSQEVRNAFVQGHSVLTLFVGPDDVPLYIGRVLNVRSRNSLEDIAFPNTHHTFFTFNPIIISSPESFVFSELLEKIEFQQGLQLLITDLRITSVILAFYHGLYQGRNMIPLTYHINKGNVNYIP
jgi:hypothetical protein